MGIKGTEKREAGTKMAQSTARNHDPVMAVLDWEGGVEALRHPLLSAPNLADYSHESLSMAALEHEG